MNFFKYKDGQDFLEKTGMTEEEAIRFLDKELEQRCRVDNANKTNRQ